MQRDDYQPKQAQTIQSAQLPPAMKDPQTAVTPPTPVVDLSKTDDEGKEEREIEATESKAAGKEVGLDHCPISPVYTYYMLWYGLGSR